MVRAGRDRQQSAVAFDAAKNEKERIGVPSVASVRERSIPTELPPLVGDVRAYFCG
jgi:hypothetical protein